MKKAVSLIVVFVLCLSIATSVSAASVDDSKPVVSEQALQEQIEEINDFLAEHSEPIDLEEQIIEYSIPLSDGSTAAYSIELTRVSQNARTIFDAKLGTWIFTSTASLPMYGEIKVNTTVNIFHVPTEMYDIVRFKAYNGNVSAIPIQFSSLTGSSAATYVVYTDTWYETKGYVGFNVLGIPINIYFTQSILCVNNTDQNTKIQCAMNYKA